MAKKKAIQPTPDNEGTAKKKTEKVYAKADDIICASNGMFVKKRVGTITQWVKISNFPLIQKRFIKVNEEKTFRLLQVGNDADIDGQEPKVIKINSESFISVDRLKKALSNIDKHFVGITQRDLDSLAVMYEGMQPTEQVKVGFNAVAKAMFFKNIAVKNNIQYTPDSFGIVEIDGSSYFMPTSIKKSPCGNIDRYTYDGTHTINFNDWFKLLFAGWGNKAVLPVCFLIMSVFRDIVDANSLFIPVLYVKGERGSGKSTLISNLTKAFGAEQKEKNLMAENTPKSIARNLSQVVSSMIWYNEYLNTMPDAYKNLPQFIYDKGGYERAKFDDTDETESIDVNSTLCLTSNFTPDNEIVYSRLIFVQIDKAKHTEEQIKAVNKLAEYKNLSCICCELQQYYDLVKDNFDKAKKQIFECLFGYFNEIGLEVDTRYIDNMSVLLAPTYILVEHKKISFNLGDNDWEGIIDIGVNNIKAQLTNFNGNSVVNSFWTTIQILFDRYDIKKDYHLKIVDAKIDGFGDTKKLAVKSDILIEQYRKYCGNNARSAQEIKDSLQQIKSFVAIRPVKFKAIGNDMEQKTTTYKQAFIFDYNQLTSDFSIDFGC